jgi:hypothetical protein
VSVAHTTPIGSDNALVAPHMPRAGMLVPLVLTRHRIGGQRLGLKNDQMTRRVVGRGGSGARGSIQSKNQNPVHAGKTLPHACPHSTDQPTAWKRVVPCVAEARTACNHGRVVGSGQQKIQNRPIAVGSCAPQTHKIPSHIACLSSKGSVPWIVHARPASHSPAP